MLGRVSLIVAAVLTDFLLVPKIPRVSAAEQSDDENTLVLLHVLFRHGDRSPDLSEVYPKDPYAEHGFTDVGYGELTKEGKYREYLIGKHLRQKYDTFLGPYGHDKVVAKSTDYIRTRMSCLLVLAGLFPPSEDQLWEKEILWQPIPYDYENYAVDKVLGDPLKNCPSNKRFYDSYVLSSDGQKFYQENKAICDYLSEHTGWNVNRAKYIYDLYFVFKSEESMGLKLPEWSKSVWPKQITLLAAEEYAAQMVTPKMVRIAVGHFLEKLLDDTDKKIKGELPDQRKIFLYSAHEYNLGFLLKALEVFTPHIPPFGSYLTIEMHKIKGVYGFKFLYQDYESSPTEPKLLKLPGCDTFCPVSEFKDIVRKFLPLPHDCED